MCDPNYVPMEEELNRTGAERGRTVEGRDARKNVREEKAR